MQFTVNQIAQICHEANKGMCEALGDYSQPTWPDAPNWMKESAIAGVQFRLENPDDPPSVQHEAWMDAKVRDGWIYGPEKDPVAKTHPCLVPFNDLPEHQQMKDHLFVAIVLELREEP